MRWWWPLVAAVALTAVAGTAAAQTVVVTNATPGTTVEVAVNEAVAGTATVDAQGGASVPIDLVARAGKAEIDASVEVEVCKDVRRVIIVERGQPGLRPEAGCTRQQISGLYLVRRGSTLLLNVGGTDATLMLLQRTRGGGLSAAPSGLMLFGGAGLAKFGNAAENACGSVTPCMGAGYGAGYAAGVDFWPLRFVGVEAAFVRPAKVKISGSGSTYRFESTLDTQLFTVSAKAGLPLGPVRIYGRAGANYLQATTTTTQTNDETSVTVDEETQAIPGGTITSAVESKGWSWTVGGGMEVWVSSWLGVYGDAGRTAVKGNVVDAEGRIDDRITAFTFGARIRIGGW